MFILLTALSHLHHHHHQLLNPNRSSPNHPHSYHPRQSYLNAHYDGSIPGSNAGSNATRSNGPVVLRRKKKQQQQQNLGTIPNKMF